MERRLQVTPRSPAARLFAEDHGRLASVKKTIRISPKNVGIEPMNWQNMGYLKTWPSYLENSMRYLVHVIGETKINTHTLGRPWSQTVGGNPSSLIFFRTKGIYTEIYVHLKWGWKIGMERSFQTNPIVPIGSIHTGVGQKLRLWDPQIAPAIGKP